MEWTPIVFVVFKVLVLGTGMFYAVKWHYDQGKKKQDKALDKEEEKRAVLRAAGKVAVVFMLGLLVLGLITYGLVKWTGLNLNM